jgi:hypothetical protein
MRSYVIKEEAMQKNVTTKFDAMGTSGTMMLLGLKSTLQKKSWFWTAAIITLSILILFNGFHFNTATFIFAPLFSLSVGCFFISVRRLVLCTRFLKPRIKNKPSSLLNQPPVDQVFKITRRCLYQFSLSISFIVFAAIAFSANQSGDLFHNFFYNLLLMTIFSGVIYGASLLFAHTYLAAALGHPIIKCLASFKPMRQPIHPPIYTYEPDESLTVTEIHDETWENWMHDPINPASAEHQSSIWNKQH